MGGSCHYMRVPRDSTTEKTGLFKWVVNCWGEKAKG